jgi:hypothetical protein
MTATQSIQFVPGRKKTRGELRLPQLHFIACDDWMKKLGRQAFCAWLEFYTYADRTRTNSTTGGDSIPTSMNKIAKKLEISKETFYNKVIRPLWNYGFIDLQEVEIHGNLCVNIIVYEYPQNEPARATLPLEQLRNYDQDYLSTSRKKSIKGAKSRKVSDDTGSKIEPPTQFENRTTPSSKIEPPPVRKSNHPSSKIERNNVLNSFKENESINVLNICQSVQSDEPVSSELIPGYERLTDRLTQLHFSLGLISQIKKLANELSLSDEQSVSALELTIKSAKREKLHYYEYFKTVFTEKAGIAKAEDHIPKTERPKYAPWVMEDKLPAAVIRQMELEKNSEQTSSNSISFQDWIEQRRAEGDMTEYTFEDFFNLKPWETV